MMQKTTNRPSDWISKREIEFWNLFYKQQEAKVIREMTGWMGNIEQAEKDLNEWIKANETNITEKPKED